MCFDIPGGSYGGNRVDTGVINWQDGVNTIAYGNGVFEINGGNLLKTGSLDAFTTTPTQSTADLRILSSSTTTATDYLPVTIYGMRKTIVQQKFIALLYMKVTHLL